MKRIFALSPNSSGLIEGTSKSLTTVEERTDSVEKDHQRSGFMSLTHPVPEQHVLTPMRTSPIATCHSGDIPTILVTPPVEESITNVEIQTNVVPQSNPVRVESTFSTGMQMWAAL